jgi:nucleotide-binding universal stress UspA family protein
MRGRHAVAIASPFGRSRRLLLPFTGGEPPEPLVELAVRLARAERAELVLAYLLIVPLRFAENDPSEEERLAAERRVEVAKRHAERLGIVPRTRVECGRSFTHALRRIWGTGGFDVTVVSATPGRRPSPAEASWILEHAPHQVVVLRPGSATPAPARWAHAT